MNPIAATTVHWIRGINLPLMAFALGYLGVHAPALWVEFHALRQDWVDDARGRMIGFPGVTPHLSLASRPENWVHDEGDSTLLWAGWDRKASKHHWFKLGKGDIDPADLTLAMGRDSIRPIDKPRLESRIGEIWKAMAPEEIVAVGEFQGIQLAYPLSILSKVLVVNDEVHTKPLLVVHNPFVEDVHAAEMINPLLDGTKKRTMGKAGYLWHGRPLLYDRETQGLWAASHDGVKCLSGESKGKVLVRIAHLDPVNWGAWSSNHPAGRLVAGAIRDDWKNPKP